MPLPLATAEVGGAADGAFCAQLTQIVSLLLGFLIKGTCGNAVREGVSKWQAKIMGGHGAVGGDWNEDWLTPSPRTFRTILRA